MARSPRRKNRSRTARRSAGGAARPVERSRCCAVSRPTSRYCRSNKIGRAHAELQSLTNLVCRLLLEKKKTNMLRKLIQDEQPKYIAAVFESGEKPFRHETFSDYKANRQQMPDDLASQMPYIKRLCEAYNVPMLSVPGFEADDVIGALASQAADQGLQSVIVSNDKDMCQLVRDPLIVCMRQNSQVIKRKEPVPPIEWCDEAWVEKKFGVTAAQVVDLLGLMGDSVDNIPGAPGIGAKGAVQIIQTYGSIENALAHWEEVKHKTYRESLRNNVELIRKSRELAQIRTDVDVQLDLNQLEARPPDRAAAYDLFRELEFTALTNEFTDGAVAAAKVEGERTYSM